LARHTCLAAATAASDGVTSHNNHLTCGAETAPYSEDDNDCDFIMMRMGHGLTEAREQNPIDAVAASILERMFQAGVEKSSRQKGVLEMAEECKEKLPSLLAPDEVSIGNWLSSRVEHQ